MSDRPVIGFIGLGFMGHGMAANLRKAGHDLWVRGRTNRVPVESLLAMGAREAASPKDMAERCDILHICLSNSPQIEAVFRGPDGILAGAHPGLIVIETSTADPASTEALAAELAAKGGHLVDAPLGGTPVQAEAGQLGAMVGCDEALFKMKLLMNFLSLSYGALYSEMLALGAKVGIPPQTIREVIGPSRMGNGFFETFMAYAVDRDPDAHKFTLANAAKDIGYVTRMAGDARVMSLMASAARHYYTHAEATGHGQDYLPVLGDLVARLNGVDLAEEVRRGA
jgi:3-hydroxyisobutyrate dehydrogenase-like beta-hydroxyacid dehydrogenase